MARRTAKRTPSASNRDRERKLNSRADAAPVSQRRTQPPQASGVRVSKRQLDRLAEDVQAVQQWRLETGQSTAAAVDAVFEIKDARARELFIAAVEAAYPSRKRA